MDIQKAELNMVKKILSNRFALAIASATVVALAAVWFTRSPAPDQAKKAPAAIAQAERPFSVVNPSGTLGSVDWEDQEPSEKEQKAGHPHIQGSAPHVPLIVPEKSQTPLAVPPAQEPLFPSLDPSPVAPVPPGAILEAAGRAPSTPDAMTGIAPMLVQQEPPQQPKGQDPKAQPDKGGGDKEPAIPLPRPRPVLPLGPDQPAVGSPDVRALGDPPIPTPEFLKIQDQYFDRKIDPHNTLDLIVGRARLIKMKDTPKRIQVVDESVMGYTIFPNAKDMTIVGRRPGTTIMNFWFPDADDKTKEAFLSYLVRVYPDPIERKRLEAIYKALEDEINVDFPDSIVRLKVVGNKVLVTGQAHDIQDATNILRFVVSNYPGGTNVRGPVDSGLPVPRPEDPDAKSGATPGASNYIASGSPNVINMLRVSGVHQVMLKVLVAEVNRHAARTIGMDFSYTNKSGIKVIENRTGGGLVDANLPINLDNGQLQLAVHALKRLSYAKSLAEPNLVTMNGQPAYFTAGGSFPVPVVAGGGLGGSVGGVSFVPYGVQLQFTPYITDKDRIRLQVNATVSTRDPASGTQIQGSNVSGLNSRNFSTVVEMRDGQSIAVAGLIQSSHGIDRDNLPFLGNIPILNRFTGIDRATAGEQELVILITPELVQPMSGHQLPRLVGSDLFEPSDLEYYLLGRMEGRRPIDFRSPVMNEWHRVQQYNHCEQRYIFGPTGYHTNPSAPPSQQLQQQGQQRQQQSPPHLYGQPMQQSSPQPNGLQMQQPAPQLNGLQMQQTPAQPLPQGLPHQ